MRQPGRNKCVDYVKLKTANTPVPLLQIWAWNNRYLREKVLYQEG